MASRFNCALESFVSQLGDEMVLAQVLIRRQDAGFELRHVDDRLRGGEELRAIHLDELRSLAQFTATGAFRPLKSAPNLRSGWKLIIPSEAELEMALNHLYPGAIADWFAAQSPLPPITHYREFTDRQTGMYRVTQKLADAQAADVIKTCCEQRFCLKRRLWTVQGLKPDSPADKSLIPCLEPCALLLEFARKVRRIEQEEKLHVDLAPSDVATLVAVLRSALSHPDPENQDANMSAAKNPRRIRRLTEKLERHLKTHAVAQSDLPEPEE